jgi:hypothetical protein
VDWIGSEETGVDCFLHPPIPSDVFIERLFKPSGKSDQ